MPSLPQVPEASLVLQVRRLYLWGRLPYATLKVDPLK
jgi:hypothetical protein